MSETASRGYERKGGRLNPGSFVGPVATAMVQAMSEFFAGRAHQYRAFPLIQRLGLMRSSPRTKSRPVTTIASRMTSLSSTAANDPTMLPDAMKAAIQAPFRQSMSPWR